MLEVLTGVLIGVVATLVIFRVFPVGSLRIDRSDPDDGPYMFLELYKNVGDISRKRVVLLRVSNKNYISQK